MRYSVRGGFSALVLAAGCFLAGASTEAAWYAKFDGVDGSVKETGYEGWSVFQALQVDLVGGIQQPSIDVSFSMDMDLSTPTLMGLLTQGQQIDSLTVHQLNEAGLVTIEHVFQDLYLGSLSLTQTDGRARVVGGLAAVKELGTTYREYDFRGGLLGSSTFYWDFGSGPASNVATLPGDYNTNGVVDALDHAKWADQYGGAMVTLGGGADGNADGSVDAADYTVWRDAYIGGVQQPSPVPEPAATGPVLLGLSIVSTARRPLSGRP